MATVTVTDTFKNDQSSGRKTLCAANASKRYTSTNYTIVYKATNNSTSKATVTFKIGCTDWNGNDSIRDLGHITVNGGASVNVTKTYTFTYEARRTYALICRNDSNTRMTGTATWTITYTEHPKPSVAQGDIITRAQMVALSAWLGPENIVTIPTQYNIIDNSTFTSGAPTEGTTIYASYYNGKT